MRDRWKVNKTLSTFALCMFHAKGAQNASDQITSDRRFKRAWSDCVLFISFILVESPNERWLHTYRACVIVTMRSGLRAPLIASNRQNLGLTQNNKVSFLRNTRTTGQNEGERSLRFYSVGDCLSCSYYVGRKQYRLDRISRLCQVIQCGRGKSSLCASCRRISRLFSLSTEQQRKRVHCWQSTMITQNL